MKDTQTSETEAKEEYVVKTWDEKDEDSEDDDDDSWEYL